MFIPLELIIIGFDPPPFKHTSILTGTPAIFEKSISNVEIWSPQSLTIFDSPNMGISSKLFPYTSSMRPGHLVVESPNSNFLLVKVMSVGWFSNYRWSNASFYIDKPSWFSFLTQSFPFFSRMVNPSILFSFSFQHFWPFWFPCSNSLPDFFHLFFHEGFPNGQFSIWCSFFSHHVWLVFFPVGFHSFLGDWYLRSPDRLTLGWRLGGHGLRWFVELDLWRQRFSHPGLKKWDSLRWYLGDISTMVMTNSHGKSAFVLSQPR